MLYTIEQALQQLRNINEAIYDDLNQLSGDARDGYLEALKTIIKLKNPQSRTKLNSKGSQIDPRMHIPNIQSQSPQQDNDTSSGNSSSKIEQQSSRIQIDINKVRELAAQQRNDADDVIDDADNLIDSDVLDQLSDEARAAKTQADIDKISARLERIKQFWDEDSIKQHTDDAQVRKVRTSPSMVARNFARYANQRHKQDHRYKAMQIDMIAQNIARTIKNEISIKRDSSWSRYNPRSDDLGYIQPGRYNKEVKDRPVVLFYFDVSGSWSGNQEKINMGHRIEQALIQLDKQKKIKLIRKYFGRKAHDEFTTSDSGNSSEPGPDIIRMQQAGLCDNLIIMTDSDPQPTSPAVIDGCVWLLFYDYVSGAVVENIKSKDKRNTFIYMIEHD